MEDFNSQNKTKKLNDLRTLLSQSKNQAFEEELSQLSVRKHEFKRPNWFQQLKETNRADKRNLSSILTPHKSDLQSPSFHHEDSLSQTFDISIQKQHQTIDKPKTNNRLESQRKTMLPPMIRGSNLESLFFKKECSLQELQDKNKDLVKENDELRKLNIKMFEKLDYLQNIIDKEADGKEFFFNYPPKPDSGLAEAVKQIHSQKNGRSPSKESKKMLLEQQEKDEVQKMRKFMENQLDKEKRLNEKKYQEMSRSFTLEVDQLQEMLSSSSLQLGSMVKTYEESTTKFNSYYSECDKYIKDRESKLTQTRQDNIGLSQELEKYQDLYNREKQSRDALQKTHDSFLKQFEELTLETNRLRNVVMKYEEKYKFIDIGKMHEKVQFLQTKLEASDSKCKILERELFDLRDKILRATSHKLQMPKNIEEKPGEVGTWNADGEVEDTAKALLQFIHNQVQSSLPQAKTQTQWNSKDKQENQNDITQFEMYY